MSGEDVTQDKRKGKTVKERKKRKEAENKRKRQEEKEKEERGGRGGGTDNVLSSQTLCFSDTQRMPGYITTLTLKNSSQLAVVAYTYNSITGEAEAGGLT